METIVKSAEQSLTKEGLLEIKMAFNNAMEIARKHLGDKVRGELSLTDAKERDVVASYYHDSKAEWTAGKSGVTMQTVEGQLTITNDSMPF